MYKRLNLPYFNPLLIVIITLFINSPALGQATKIKEEIHRIVKGKQLELGFASLDFSNGDTLSINGEKRFPMQSVFKFPLALAVLNEVDHKKYELNQNVRIGKDDLRPGLWSPIERKYPGGDINLPLSEIIKYTVAQSDNVGCDLLLKMLGGPSKVNTYMHDKGITDISIKNNERELQSSWSVQFENWTTPHAMIRLLKRFNNKELLSPDTHAFLWDVMSETSTGSVRHKLPANAFVAYKTGTSGYNAEKVSAATNCVGIIARPNGERVAFAIFITNSKETPEVNGEVIADIAALLYEAKP